MADLTKLTPPVLLYVWILPFSANQKNQLKSQEEIKNQKNLVLLFSSALSLGLKKLRRQYVSPCLG